MWLKSIKENKTDYLYWGYLGIIGIIFYLMNYFTPLSNDDWHYKFKFGTNLPIQNITDIFESQYTHYFQMNGRFINHFILQFFDGIIGKELFNIVNTIIFLLFIHFLSCIITRKKESNIQLSSIYLFIIVIFSTTFGEWYLWMSGACNYLWPATFLIMFHYILSKNINNKSIYPLLFIGGIICGWTHECITIGAGVGYFIYYLINKKQITYARISQLLGFYIGIILLIISPGNLNRALNSGTFETFNIINYIWTVYSLKELSILLILLIIVIFYIYKKKTLYFLKNNIYILIPLIISISFIVFIKVGTSRSFFGIFFFSLILVLKFISQIRNRNFLFYLSILILSLGIFPTLSTSARNYNEYKNLISQIEKTNDGIIITNEVKVNPLIEKYIIKLYHSEYSEFYDGYIKTNYINRHIATTFNKKQIVFIPELFIKEINNRPDTYDEFIIPSQHPFYAKKIQKDTITNVIFHLNKTKTEDIPFYLKPISNKLDRFNLEKVKASQWSVLSINNQNYLLVGKNWAVDNRVKDIIYE